MKILYLSPLLKDSGGQIHVKEFSSAIQKLNHDIVLGFDKIAIAQKDIPKMARKMPRFLKELAIIVNNRKYRKNGMRAIREHNPDILMVRDCLFNFWGEYLVQKSSLPFVLEVNAPHTLETQYFSTLSLSYLAKRAEERTWHRADAIIVVSKTIKEILISRGISEEKICVVQNGVNPEKFHSGINGEDVRNRYSLEGRVVIGFIGSLKKWHGVGMLLEVGKKIIESSRDVTFLVVGDGPLKHELKKYVLDNNLQKYVIFTGRIDHDKIPPYIAAMDIAVLPYPAIKNFYFSPLKLYEFMAMGKPIIASRLGQIQEVLEAGRDSELVKPGNQKEWYEKLIKLIDNQDYRAYLGQNVKMKGSQFTWDRNAKMIEDILYKVLGKFK